MVYSWMHRMDSLPFSLPTPPGDEQLSFVQYEESNRPNIRRSNEIEIVWNTVKYINDKVGGGGDGRFISDITRHISADVSGGSQSLGVSTLTPTIHVAQQASDISSNSLPPTLSLDQSNNSASSRPAHQDNKEAFIASCKGPVVTSSPPPSARLFLDTFTVPGQKVTNNKQHVTAESTEQPRRLSRRLAPGLLARLKLLDTRRRSSVCAVIPILPQSVGRISESRIQEFEESKNASEAARRQCGQLWSDGPLDKLELSLPITVPNSNDNHPPYREPTEPVTLTDMATLGSHHDDIASDMSSILSVSDHPVLSESDEEHLDTQKYILPDMSKSRGSSRNGFALPDGRMVGREQPPTPPPKDALYSPQRPSIFGSSDSLADQFNPYGLQRTNSIYTLSRASLSNQLSQLTSIKLPDAASLESNISSIPTSIAAARMLNDAAGQIKIWITKANEVLEGLDAEDDVEWSAAAGREGLAEVDQAINTFNALIIVFVNAIDNLESRPDIGKLSNKDQSTIVTRGERIVEDWEKIKVTLEGVKEQVEVAMEWEELWNTVLGEIGQEEESLNRFIFEMEEKRHRNSLLDAMAEPGQNLDIKELETIVEEAPVRVATETDAAAETPAVPVSQAGQDDSNLLSLTARMQPLRASLDFLPMRLSGFLTRGKDAFPTACEELQTRMRTLEQKYQKLEADAEALRKELGEDRWVLIFRKAGRQAFKMCESVERSVAKLRDSLDEGTHHTNPPALTKKIENYEAKKEHYGPAIQQVLAIIDRGVQTRLTVNGEILRLQADMHRRWADVDGLIKSMNFALDQLNISRARQLRDSVSTILSEQRSVSSSVGTFVDTPLSSPASSVILFARNPSDGDSNTPLNSKSRQGSFTSTSTAHRRISHLPTPVRGEHQSLTSRASTSRLSGYPVSSRLYPGPPPRSESRTQSRQDNNTTPSSLANRPRWNSSTNTSDTPLGHNFKPLSTTISSPHAKVHPSRSTMNLRQASSASSPLGRSVHDASALRTPGSTLGTTRSSSRLNLRPNAPISHIPSTPATNAKRSIAASSYATPSITPSTAGVSGHRSRSSINSTGSSSTQTERQTTLLTPNDTPSTTAGNDSPGDVSPSARAVAARPSIGIIRPGSSLAASGGGRRISMLPTPKRAASGIATAAAVSAMSNSTASGGDAAARSSSRLSRVGTSAGMHSVTEERPRWR